jgi:hypothetical protein
MEFGMILLMFASADWHMSVSGSELRLE